MSSFASNTLTRINSTAGRDDGGGKVTVRITGTNDKDAARYGRKLQGTGDFTASGAISDRARSTSTAR